MKTLLWTSLACCAATACIAADTPTLRADPTPEKEQQLIKVEKNWMEAIKAHDQAALTALCAEGFLSTDEEGKVSDKAHYLTEAADYQVKSYTFKDLTTRVYGDTGIVSGKWKGTVVDNGADTELALRFTDTLVLRNNRWWVIATQVAHVTE